MNKINLKKIFVILLLTWIGSAHAYIDPGSSLLLLQGLLAAIVSVAVFVRHPIEGLKKIYRKMRGHKDA